MTHAPHVVVLATLADLGGAERSLVELIRHSVPGLRFTVVLPEPGPLAAALEDAGAAVRVVPWPAALLRVGERSATGRRPLALCRAALVVPALVARLRRALREIGPDVLVTNGMKAHLLGVLVGRIGHAPLLWYGREGLEGRALSARLLAIAGRRCDGAIAISEYVAGELRRVLPAATPVEVIYNLIDQARCRPGRPLPGDLAKAPNALWFGIVGALTPLKGQDLFLEAAARIAERVPDARFLVVGGSPYRSESASFALGLPALAARLGIASRVEFLGARDDVEDVLSNLDVLVQANRGPEGLGRTVLEAMACEVPVIAVDRWGPAEVVRDGETGVLCPPGDVGALATAMERLARDAAARTALASAAQGWIARELAPPRLVTRFRAFLSARLREDARAGRSGADSAAPATGRATP